MPLSVHRPAAKKMCITNEHSVNSARTNCFFVYYMIPPTGGCYLLLLEYLHHNRYLLLPTTNFKCWIDFSEERHFEDLGAIEDAIKTLSKKLHSIPSAQAFEQF